MEKFKKCFSFILLLTFILFVFHSNFYSQCNYLVWSDEFSETNLDQSKWSFDIGPTNDNVHYYTDRTNNVYVENGVLKIAALEESYSGWNYTSGLIKTERISAWKYGRIEARIKLPQSPGFVPAFWLQPEDNLYGWWPNSGEIDIMEHPTNEIQNIYGTIHSAEHSYFTGSTPEGSNISIPTAESDFHIYAVEWTESKIDFFVDSTKYFTYTNDYSGYNSWPFDQPFYIILNLAVGGGWVGNPNSNTIFPAIMEVDYVRVYQNLSDVNIFGKDFVDQNSENIIYSLPKITNAIYNWHTPSDMIIASGDNTNSIQVNFGDSSGIITCDISNDTCSNSVSFPVNVSGNYFLNGDFEKGVKYWYGASGNNAETNFELVKDSSIFGNKTLKIDVKKLGTYSWDIQVSQRDFYLEQDKEYTISFWAKVQNNSGKFTATLIDPVDFTVYKTEIVNPDNKWKQYSFKFIPQRNIHTSFNLDFGYQINTYFIDNFEITLPENKPNNNLINSDFSNGDNGWTFTSYWPAVAQGAVENGEYKVSITNGGQNVWDINLSQLNIVIEQGKKYEISFDAYASNTRTISALVGKNSDPWTVYSGSNIIEITNSKQNYKYNFIMNYPTDNTARLGFDIGANSEDLYLDNIYLTEIKDTISTYVISEDLPHYFQLNQNYPNPFNPTTTIKYSIPNIGSSLNSNVELKVFDVLGREVKTLVNQKQKPGNYIINFNDSELSSGIYFYRLQTGNFVQTKKMMFLK